MAPVPVSNVAPAGRAGAMLQLSVPAQSVFVAAGVTVSSDNSSTVWSAIAAISTVPTLCVTVIANSSVSASPVAAVAVSVYGP